jgi:prepilin peptidase CpaA
MLPFLDSKTGVLLVLLLAAAFSDIRSRRVPNALVFGGALYALLYHALSAEGGIPFALGGVAVGLGGLLPLYLLCAMGAGDVKLMAMVGAFLGAPATFGALLSTLVAGGVLAVALALASGRFLPMLGNLLALCRGTLLGLGTGVGGLTVLPGPSAGRMPYAVAIAGGTTAYLVLAQLGLPGAASW